MRLVRTGLLGMMLLGACSPDPTGAGERRLEISMDKRAYSLASDSVASITLHNSSGAEIYLPMGEYVLYERRVDGKWAEARSWFIVDGIGRAIKVSPGATQSSHLPLRFYLRGKPGTYRIQYLAYEDNRLRHMLPLEQRVSVPFTVSP